MEQGAIPEILFFKTAYVPAEDRLLFSCALKGGGSDALWLTQQLTNILVRKLVDWLDKTSVQDKRFAEHTHKVAQQSALANRPKGPPPAPIEEVPARLVHSVSIRSNAKNVVLLTFKDGAERAVGLQFDARHLRHWLNVLHGQYRRSGWPTGAWPDWMAEVAGDKAPEDRGLLH
jgi:hypothetical protein